MCIRDRDNIDAEEAARIAADNALGKRIDKEIEDRKAADSPGSTRKTASN